MVVEEEEVVVEVGVAPDVDDEDVEDVGPAGAEEEGEVVVSSWLLLLPPTEPDVTVTKACAPACGWAPPDVETELGAVAGVEAGVDAGADAGTEEGAEDGAEAGAALLRFRTVTWTGCALAPPIRMGIGGTVAGGAGARTCLGAG